MAVSKGSWIARLWRWLTWPRLETYQFKGHPLPLQSIGDMTQADGDRLAECVREIVSQDRGADRNTCNPSFVSTERPDSG